MGIQLPLRYAIIHLGATSTRIHIVEYRSIDDVKIIERARQEVTFGEELFQTKRLSFQTIEEICRILKGYKQLMADYGVTEYKLYGTVVVREALNRRSIIDQIFITTGMEVSIIDMPKEIYYKYFMLYLRMNEIGLSESKDATLFLDITSGGVGMTIWKGGSLLFQENVHIGSLRVMESFNRNQRSSLAFPQAIGDYLSSMLHPVHEEVRQFNVKHVVLSGEEAVQIAKLMGYQPRIDETLSFAPGEFEAFIKGFHGISATKLVNRYGLSEYQANLIMPTMILYHEIISMVRPMAMIVSSVTFADGITLHYGAEKENSPYLHMVREQHVQLARSIAKRYQSDANHANAVERFGAQICDALTENGITARSGYLYRIAAILNDIGKFVSLRNNGLHAYHIIQGTDIFGLSDEEKTIVANVVYYHYKGTPCDEDSNFAELEEVNKIRVTKLVAILRIARALDAGHVQKVQRIEVERAGKTLVITAITDKDVSLEKWIFEREAAYFGEVYGLEIKLRIGGMS